MEWRHWESPGAFGLPTAAEKQGVGNTHQEDKHKMKCTNCPNKNDNRTFSINIFDKLWIDLNML